MSKHGSTYVEAWLVCLILICLPSSSSLSSDFRQDVYSLAR